jgi:A/G-specific adenine glycosylase
MLPDFQSLRLSLLDWYDRHARDLPWRVLPKDREAGHVADPYRVWLSEIMLQQTTIATVTPYFERFLLAFPNVKALALAPIDDVLPRWAGLGYYARGRNLHKGAIEIVARGDFPKTRDDLATLPGVGPYTAAAIAAIAFDKACVPVDGNVERVLSRLLRIEAVLPQAKAVFRDAAKHFEDEYRPGDFAQALMDLGSTICKPKKPKCGDCPWHVSCLSTGRPDLETLPRKAPKKVKALLYSAAFVQISDAGILVARRPDKGLLGGMLEVPNTDWRSVALDQESALTLAPIAGLHWKKCNQVRHIFTHIDLRMDVYATFEQGRGERGENTQRLALEAWDQAALPSLMMKVIDAGLEQLKLKD